MAAEGTSGAVMARTRRSLPAPLLGVIVLFFGLQVFILDLLIEKNNEYKADVSHSLWIAAQLQTEYLRFMGALDRFAADTGPAGRDELQRRLDILVSRLPLFQQGERAAIFGQIKGARETVSALQEVTDKLEPKVRSLLPNETEEYLAIRDQFDLHRITVHKMVLDTFLADEAVTAQIKEQNDRVYWLLIIAIAGTVISGAVLVLVLIRQVRRAERAEAEAKQERNRAIGADKAKSEFLANMSHELRTPLNAIMGFTEVMKLEILGRLGNDRYREYVDDIRDCGVLLTRLIEDILDLSKVEAGKYELREESVDLAKIAKTSLHLFTQESQSKGIVLSAKFPDHLPRMYGDPRVLQQIILNLLSNAIKFTPSGGEVSMEIVLRPDRSLSLSVIDSGVGISKADIKVALAPFGQVADVMTKNHSGTGLGLPLAKLLVELHDGLMEIESEPNLGTCVTIIFPSYRLNDLLAA